MEALIATLSYVVPLRYFLQAAHQDVVIKLSGELMQEAKRLPKDAEVIKR